MLPKYLAATKAINYVTENIVLGLGTGSTTEIFIELLSKELKNFNNLIVTSTSKRTTRFADKLGIKITPFENIEKVNLTIDGADEVSIELNGIKGGGGALLFEKIIAKNSDINIWIVDHSKLVNKLGNFPLPIEIVPFATKSLLRKFEMMKLNPKLRMNGDMIFTTDSQNHIIDCYLGDIANPIDLEYELKLITGVVEVGLFNQIANKVIIGYPDKTEILVRK